MIYSYHVGCDVASFFSPTAAAYVSMYQAGAVVGIILIGCLSDLLIRQVCVTVSVVA